MTVVLIVDDDPLVASMMSDVVQSMQYQSMVAASGEAALAILKGPGKVDIMLADVMMQGMNGIELAERAAVCRPALRIILTSGYPATLIPIPTHCQFIGKPYALRDLVTVLRAATDRLTNC